MYNLNQIHLGIYKRIMSFKWKFRLSHFGNNSLIHKPLQIIGGGGISIGSNVIIQYRSWLAAEPLTGAHDCRLEIHDSCIIGHFNEIYATRSIIIEKDVLTADRVYISDNLHGYEDIGTPIHRQPIVQNGDGVRIGEGSGLGVGVSVLGANIGRHCVIGANAVVTKDIPDYCVAAGIPARIIKRYDFDSREWRKTTPDGHFK